MSEKLAGLLVSSALVLMALIPALPGAGAQLNYSFALSAEYVDVHINMDGSVTITYQFDFVNYGDLDGVDIGLPNGNYDLGTATATVIVDGVNFIPGQIHKSPWIEVGVAVEFTSQIRNLIEVYGREFTLLFSIKNDKMVWENELVEGGVGVHMMPTWFDPSFQRSSTGYLRARLFFPPGFSNITEAVWLYNQPWDAIEFNTTLNLVIATWEATDIDLALQADGWYNFGAGFPSGYVNKFYRETIWDKAGAVFGSIGDFICANICCIIPAVLMAIVISHQLWWTRRKKDYFKPHMTVTGAGPRRGLTAPEAAIVLERPLDMVATMVLFGMAKKGLVSIQPLDRGFRIVKEVTAEPDRVYESQFLESIDSTGHPDPKKLEDAMTHLIRDVRQKLIGFDYNATKKYYGVICDKAWKQVQEAGTPEMVVGALDEQNQWLMLDKDYENRMNTFYLYHPVFIGQPVHTGPKETPINIQGVAQGYVSRVRTTSKSLVSNLESFAATVTGRTNKATNVLGEIGKALDSMESGSSGGFGGGGGGGGCACACACACAGGGR